MSTHPIRTEHGNFYDRQGRQVLLHGINFVNKNPQEGYLGAEESATFAAFRRWGFNCLRLGVIWDGLEPQPGVYNEVYLQGIERQLNLAHANGLYVFLDMHQDLYSVLYSDGAPAWATLHEGQPHVGENAVWSDAYFDSPAVQTALDNFWRNAPAADDIGLQDHLAACWKLLAQRFGQHPALIGYDLLNEPMMGRAAPQALAAQFAGGAEVLRGMGEEASQALTDLSHQTPADLTPTDLTPRPPSLKGKGGEEEGGVMEMWMTTEGRSQILQLLTDPQVYAAVLEAPTPFYQQFEQEQVMPYFRRAAAAIRTVDADGVLFLETSMGSNMGIYSAVQPLEGEAQQAYAPHGYDLVVDTPDNAHSSAGRVNLIFSRHAESAQRHQWPMLVGEWGAFGKAPDTLRAAWDAVHVFERLLCSETYWAYQEQIEDAACFQALWRPYPERVAGRLESYCYDEQSRSFECAWQEDPAASAPTVIYLPAWRGFNAERMQVESAGPRPVEIIRQADGVWLHIPPTEEAVKRVVRVLRNE